MKLKVAALTLFLCLASTITSTAQNEGRIRGQVTNSLTHFPVEGAEVILDLDPVDGQADYETTTGPFGFYEIKGVALGNYTLEISHRIYLTKSLSVIFDSTVWQTELVELIPRIGYENPDTYFDIYVQVNCALSGWAIPGVPVQVLAYNNQGDSDPASSYLVQTNTDGSIIVYGVDYGYYRFLVNQPGNPGYRSGWESYTTESTANDLLYLLKTHMAQVYLKPVPQEMTVKITGVDLWYPEEDLFPSDFNAPLKDIYVVLEGVDPEDTNFTIIPPRTGVTKDDGTVTFKGLPGISYKITARRLGFMETTTTVDADTDGILPTTPVELRIQYYTDPNTDPGYHIHVKFENGYKPFIQEYFEGMRLVGIKGTNTEGIKRHGGVSFQNRWGPVPDLKYHFYDLLPGRYRLSLDGVIAITSQDLNTDENYFYFWEDMVAHATGNMFVEISRDRHNEVTMETTYQPVEVRGRLVAADRKGDPGNNPIYLPVANKTVHFIENEAIDALPDDQKDVTFTTDEYGDFEATIWPGIYGITVDGMSNYVGESVLITPVVATDPAQQGITTVNAWPLYEKLLPQYQEYDFVFYPYFDIDGLTIGDSPVIDLELRLRKEVYPVEGKVYEESNPTGDLALITDVAQNVSYWISYSDLTASTQILDLVTQEGVEISGNYTRNDDRKLIARWMDVPPGEYTVDILHPRYSFNTLPLDFALLDYPEPGRFPNAAFFQMIDLYQTFNYPLDTVNLAHPTSYYDAPIQAAFDNPMEARVVVYTYDQQEDKYPDTPSSVLADYITVDYASGTFVHYGLAPVSGWQGYVRLFYDGEENWYSFGPGGTIYLGGLSATPPSPPQQTVYNYSVDARLVHDRNKSVSGVNYTLWDKDGNTSNNLTPGNFTARSGPPGIEQSDGLDNWIWEGSIPFPEIDLSSGTPTISQKFFVNQGMEVILTLTNAYNSKAIPHAAVQLLSSNGATLDDPTGFLFNTKKTDELGKVTFNSVPGYRDYFLRVQAPGFQPMLHRLSADQATVVTDDPSTNFRHTVPLPLPLLDAPVITTTGVPFDRYGAFLPGVSRSGSAGAFDAFAADNVLTCRWELQFTRKTHSYELPGFDNSDGTRGTPVDITLVDDIREVWLVDRRQFAKDFNTDDPTTLTLPQATDPTEVLSALNKLRKTPVTGDNPVPITFFTRSKNISPVEGDNFKANGKFKVYDLPPGNFDPLFVVITRTGAVGMYGVSYTGEPDKQLAGAPIPPWLGFAFDVIGFSGGVAATQDEIAKFVPQGAMIPFPEFTAKIERHQENDAETKYIDYEYRIAVLQKEGQDSPSNNLTGLAAGVMGGEWKAEAGITMPGKEGKLDLFIEGSITQEDIQIENFNPKMLKGYNVDASIKSVTGSVLTTASKNISETEPWDVRLKNVINFNLDATFEMDMEPVLGKIPYAGPVLTGLNKVGALEFIAVTEAGIGFDKTYCWETLRPRDIGGTTTDPDPRVKRRHFLGGKIPQAGTITDCVDGQVLCFRFGVGMDIKVAGDALGAEGRIRLKGKECAGKPSVNVVPNDFGDWPPIKSISGEATADLKAYLKTLVWNFEKEWSWSLIKFNAQFGTETLFQLIPMEVNRVANRLSESNELVFSGNLLVPISTFNPLGGYQAESGQLLFTDYDNQNDVMRLQLSERSGNAWGAPQSLVSAAVIIKPQILKLGDGRILVVWLQVAEADKSNPFATTDLMYVISDPNGSHWSQPQSISPMDNIPAVLKLFQSGNLVGLALLSPSNNLMADTFQLKGTNFSQGNWSNLVNFGAPAKIRMFDVGATGPNGPSEAHVSSLDRETGNLSYYRWVGGTPPASQTVSGGKSFQKYGAYATPEGQFGIIGTTGDAGLSIFSANSPDANYDPDGMITPVGGLTGIKVAYLRDNAASVILIAWLELTENGSKIRYAFVDGSGNILQSPTELTGNRNGNYRNLQISPLDNRSARLFALFENSPPEMRSFFISYTGGLDGNDSDGDGLNDIAELFIIDDNPGDAILVVSDVLGTDDYDGDGFDNGTEINEGTDPTDPNHFPTLSGVIVSALTSVAKEFGPEAGQFQFQRPADDSTDPLTLYYSITGTATSGDDYIALPSNIGMSAGKSSQNLDLVPVTDGIAEGEETVQLTLLPDNGYAIGTPDSATITIKDMPADTWRVLHFPDAYQQPISFDNSDAEGDGILNLLEYALYLDPSLADRIGLPQIDFYTHPDDGKTYLMLTYTKVQGAVDIDYEVQATDDLSTGIWQAGPGFTEEVLPRGTDNDGNPVISVRDTVPVDDVTAIKRFIRLKVTRTVPN